METATLAPDGGSNDEAALLARVAAGEMAAFEVLYRRYQPRLLRYLERVTRRPDLIEEVLNDVMLAVWRGARHFEGRSKVSTWILGIAYRKAMKALDRNERRLESLTPETLERHGGEDRGLRRRELRLTLDAALAELGPQQRAVVELTYYYGYSYEEIACIVGAPVNTVKTRMFYARRRLLPLLVATTAPARRHEETLP